MPGDPQPKAEEFQGSRWSWDPGAGLVSGETDQASVHGAWVTVLCPCDAVDCKQGKQRKATQTTGGVPQLPLIVFAGYSEESDWHGLQVTFPYISLLIYFYYCTRG